MDINVVAQLIGSVGYPTAMSIFLIYFIQTEMKEMRKTIENNTLTMQKVVDSLDDLKREREA